MTTATTTGTNAGLGDRIANALFAEVDRRRQEQGPTALGRDVLRPAFVAIIEREAREYVQGKPAKHIKPCKASEL